MGKLAFWEERDTDGDKRVAVGRGEAVDEGTAESLNSRGGACEPEFGNAENFAIAAVR